MPIEQTLNEFQMSASQLMSQCADNLEKPKVFKSAFKLMKESQQSQSISPRQAFKEINKISPQQQEENNRIIQKLRKKVTKKNKQVFIRKTDLGENQLIFTPQQMEKLKMIDEYQLLGLQYKQNQEDKKQESKINSQNIKKITLQENTSQQISSYLEWVDLNSMKNVKTKNQHKKLKFQVRQFSPSDPNCPKTSKAVPNYHIKSQVQIKKINLAKTKNMYPLAKKTSVDHHFLRSISGDCKFKKTLSKKQKLMNIIKRVNRKIEEQLTDKKHVYMTEERRQAMFQCQLLRRIKSQLGPKFYQKLQLKIGRQEKQQNCVQKNTKLSVIDQEKQNRNNMYNYSQKTAQLPIETSQAYKNLQKNRNRIKDQRKRVIHKMIC